MESNWTLTHCWGGGNPKWYHHCEKQLGGFLATWTYTCHMTYQSCSREMKIHIHKHTHKTQQLWMFTAASCVITKSWWKPKCPSTGKVINNRILLSSKWEGMTDTCYNMEGSQKHAQWKSQSQKGSYILNDFIYMICCKSKIIEIERSSGWHWLHWRKAGLQREFFFKMMDRYMSCLWWWLHKSMNVLKLIELYWKSLLCVNFKNEREFVKIKQILGNDTILS